eukprot:4419087-Pleurochrysis_carterae.AAC.4
MWKLQACSRNAAQHLTQKCARNIGWNVLEDVCLARRRAASLGLADVRGTRARRAAQAKESLRVTTEELIAANAKAEGARTHDVALVKAEYAAQTVAA